VFSNSTKITQINLKDSKFVLLFSPALAVVELLTILWFSLNKVAKHIPGKQCYQLETELAADLS
jgi:hypothetical protein